jgi:hypothetical protein
MFSSYPEACWLACGWTVDVNGDAADRDDRDGVRRALIEPPMLLLIGGTWPVQGRRPS